MDAQRRGSKTRQKAGTALNYSSSRSHAVFTIALHATGHTGREPQREVLTYLRSDCICGAPLRDKSRTVQDSVACASMRVNSLLATGLCRSRGI